MCVCPYSTTCAPWKKAAFTDDFFIPQIALYVARKFRIPIVSCIGDDYYFNDRFSLSPLYHLYRSRYKALIRRVFAHGGSAIYISDKIRDKYNGEFSLEGRTVYLTSELRRREFRQPGQPPRFAYFGNIGLGRYRSLYDIGRALEQISPHCYLDIYSNQQDPEAKKLFASCPAIRFRGSVSYAEVQKQIGENDVFIIVEGFEDILVYGSAEAGVVSYMESTGAAVVCTRRDRLTDAIRQLLTDREGRKQRYDNARAATEKNHNLNSSTGIFRDVVSEAIKNYDQSEL